MAKIRYICGKKSITSSRFIQLYWAQQYEQKEDARKILSIGLELDGIDGAKYHLRQERPRSIEEQDL